MGYQRPIALDAYTELADRFAESAPAKMHNAYIEQPAVRSVLGDVDGLRVLDAGCGPGILADYMAQRGAKVTGLDVTPRMLQLARKRLGTLASLLRADLALPLPFRDGCFDLAVSCLAIDYVRDWSVPLAEFRRVLKPGCRLVFSIQHPMGSYRWYKPPSAFGVQLVSAAWSDFGGEPVDVPDYYRSFEEVVNPVLEAGLILEGLTEARPIEALRELHPAEYERYSQLPTFLVVSARAPGH